jgi:hypothetical protein
MRGYNSLPQVWRAFVTVTDVPDFKEVARVDMSDAPGLEEVDENADYKKGKFTDRFERYAISTFGKIVTISRKMIINDDLGAIQKINEKYGRAAAQCETDVVYAALFSKQMADAKTVFRAENTAATTNIGVIGDSTLSAARKTMRLQKGLASTDDPATAPGTKTRPLNLAPKYLLVPASLETAALKACAPDIFATQVADINIFKSVLTPLVDPMLDGVYANSDKAWYLVADPMQVETIELAYLQGQRSVYLEQDVRFENDGVSFKARLDVGAHPIDWRGFYKNPGQA